MLQSAIDQMIYKEERKKEEEKMEGEFKKKLMEKFSQDERLEQFNAQRRRAKEIELKKEIEKQWQEKLKQYKLQKEQELQDLENQKRAEVRKRELIEMEKEKLIKEHEEILKTYFAKGYYKSLNNLQSTSSSQNK